MSQYIVMGAVCCFFFLAFVPLVADFTLSFFDQHRLLQGFLLILSSSCLIFGPYLKRLLRAYHALPIILVSIFIVLGLFSSMFSEAPLSSLLYTLHIALLFMMTAIISVIISRVQAMRLIMLLVITHSALVLYSLLFLLFSLFDTVPISVKVIYYGFDNIRFYNQAQLLVMPLLLFFTQNPRFGNLASLILVLNLVLMFVGQGLGAAIVWPALLIFFSFYNKNLAAKWLVVSLACYFIAMFIIDLKSLSNSGGVIAITDGGRIPLWIEAVSQLQWSHLLVGSGPGLFSGEVSMVVLSHPHNALLELLVEWGLLALIIATILIGATVRFIAPIFSHKEGISVEIGVFGAWLGGLAYSMVSGVLVMPVPQTIFFLFWGMLLAWGLSERRSIFSDKLSSTSNTFVVLASSVPGILLLSYVVLFSVSILGFDPLSPAMQGPRFWSNGEYNF